MGQGIESSPSPQAYIMTCVKTEFPSHQFIGEHMKDDRMMWFGFIGLVLTCAYVVLFLN